MDYLYKTIQKEIGITPAEGAAEAAESEDVAENAQAMHAVSAIPLRPVITQPIAHSTPQLVPHAAPQAVPRATREPAAEAHPGTAKKFSPASLQEATIRRVLFPVRMESLYCLRLAESSREQRLALEQYRVLRSRVIELSHERGLRTLMVTSALAGEAKTTTSINLALAISQVQGKRVCLVDADMRKVGVADALGISYEKGLPELLHGQATLQDVVLQLTDSLYLLPSGNTDQNSADVLHSAAMSDLAQTLKASFDVTIFDAPPLFPVADARILANLVDGAVLCVHAGRTSTAMVQEAAELIRPKLLGSVLVGAQIRSSPYYYYDSKSDTQE